MIKDRNAARELFSVLAVAFLLLASAISGELVFAVAFALLSVGFVVFPEMRRAGVLSAVLAALVACGVVLLLRNV